jgi:hypothetical protein
MRYNGGMVEAQGNLEQNVAKVGEWVVEYAEGQPSVEGRPEREIVKEAVQGWDQEGTPNESPGTGMDSSDAAIDEDSVLPEYLSGEGVTPEATDEVKALVGMALHDDVEKALKVARGRSAFVEDAFHDALVDKVLPLMKERGLI